MYWIWKYCNNYMNIFSKIWYTLLQLNESCRYSKSCAISFNLILMALLLFTLLASISRHNLLRVCATPFRIHSRPFVTYFAFDCASCEQIYRLYPLWKQLRLQKRIASDQWPAVVPGKSICCNCGGACGSLLHRQTTTCRLGSLSLLARQSIYIYIHIYSIFLLFCRQYWSWGCPAPRLNREQGPNPITFKIINLCTYQKAEANANAQCGSGQGTAPSHRVAESALTHPHTHAFVLSTVDRLRGEYSYVKLWRQRRLRSAASLRASQTLAHLIFMLLS